MLTVKEAIAEAVKWGRKMETNPDPGGGMLGVAIDDMVSAAQLDPEGTWEVFRSGTDDEFSALVNSVAELGDEFNTDEANAEIVRLAKKRNNPDVMEETRMGFGVLFEKYYNAS